MALETLIASQREAADLLGIDFAEVEAAQQTTVHKLGKIAIGDEEYSAYRAHCGDPSKVAKGGIRFAEYPSDSAAEAVVEELATEMLWKPVLRGHTAYRGGKGLVNGRFSSSADKEEAARQFEALMEQHGFVDHTVDIPAGDVGTNGLADIYFEQHRERHPEDHYGAAVITGKSPENGGLEFRSAATGWGVYVTQLALLDHKEQSNVTSTVQGFGNVASWYAYFASNDPNKRVSVQGISELEGTLTTADPDGLPITLEMVQQVGDNPKFEGSKIDTLVRMIREIRPDIELTFTPDPNAIITHPTDYFIPAAMGNVITEDNASSLGARYGVIEAANGPTTLAADRYLAAKGIDVVPDIVANGSGVDCSITELEANIAMADGIITEMPSSAAVQKELENSSRQLLHDVIAMAERMGTKSLRVAAAGLGMVRLLGRSELELAA